MNLSLISKKRLKNFPRVLLPSHPTPAPLISTQLSCLSASPCPWKNRKLSAKSATKIPTSEITTADVVDSPTPFAPPVVVVPQLHDTTEMIAPKTQDLMQLVATSQGITACIWFR